MLKGEVLAPALIILVQLVVLIMITMHQPRAFRVETQVRLYLKAHPVSVRLSIALKAQLIMTATLRQHA